MKRRLIAGAVALAGAALIGWRVWSDRDRSGEAMLAWEPCSPTPYPANVVTVYIRGDASIGREWERAIVDYKITSDPILRVYEIQTHAPYAGPDSSVMTVGQYGDTLYWRKVWAMLEKTR
jgi:hypothetical protein